MNIDVKLDEGAFLPERAHDTDAGADLRCMEDVTIYPHTSKVIDTGVHVELPPGTAGLIWSKSGLNVNNKILTTGLVDEGFTGSIKVRVYNHGERPYTFAEGDKVTQLVVIPVCYPEYTQVDAIVGGERGDSGYGSTGR